MRGNNVMKGYFADEEATAEAFRGGWFHSGDLGVMHPDGYIEVRDRAKDIIISGGENISTIEVEQALVRHPDVLEARRRRDPGREMGRAAQGLRDPAAGRRADAEELIAFSRETLPGFKAPSEIEFGELPKTSTGKVKKYELRARARERTPVRASYAPSYAHGASDPPLIGEPIGSGYGRRSSASENGRRSSSVTRATGRPTRSCGSSRRPGLRAADGTWRGEGRCVGIWSPNRFSSTTRSTFQYTSGRPGSRRAPPSPTTTSSTTATSSPRRWDIRRPIASACRCRSTTASEW